MPEAPAGYFLVRDQDGNPKFDDYNNIPQVWWDMLTEAEKASIIEKRGN
jgi:hypothetical protein